MANSESGTNDPAIHNVSTSSEVLSLDNSLDVLTNRRRRYVFYCLREYQTPMSLADLANEVTARERDMPVSELPAEDVKRIYASLYHLHIPELEGANIVEYTEEQDLIRLTENREKIELLLERVDEDE